MFYHRRIEGCSSREGEGAGGGPMWVHEARKKVAKKNQGYLIVLSLCRCLLLVDRARGCAAVGTRLGVVGGGGWGG